MPPTPKLSAVESGRGCLRGVDVEGPLIVVESEDGLGAISDAEPNANVESFAYLGKRNHGLDVRACPATLASHHRVPPFISE